MRHPNPGTFNRDFGWTIASNIEIESNHNSSAIQYRFPFVRIKLPERRNKVRFVLVVEIRAQITTVKIAPDFDAFIS